MLYVCIHRLRSKWGGSQYKSLDGKGHKTKMLIGRAMKQNRLKIGRVTKQSVFLTKKSGAPPVS